MTDRGQFLYQNDEGVIYVSFEKGGKGLPIETLLPESGRGAGFETFKISDYFNLANMVLVEPKEWVAFCKAVNTKGATPFNPTKVSPPPINLDFLGLRDGEYLKARKTEELFTIVASYWTAPQNTMALEPGLVAGLWHSGMSAPDIIQYIRNFTMPDGTLNTPSGRGADIMNQVMRSFIAAKGFPKDVILSKRDVSQMVDRWMLATRSSGMGTKDAGNTALHWADYRQLGLIDKAGRADIAQVKALAAALFGQEQDWTFDDTLAWAEHRSGGAKHNHKAQIAQAKLKKKRKQGRLNRKRGRR